MSPDEILPPGDLIELTKHLSAIELFIIISAISSLFVATAYPVVKMIQNFTSEKNTDVKRNEAEELLYTHLIEQIVALKEELDNSIKENRKLWDQIRELEKRTSRLEILKSDYDILKKLIREKDAEIKEKTLEISRLKILTEK